MAKKTVAKSATGSAELLWQGDLAVRRIATLKDELLSALDGQERLTLRLANVDEVDLAFLQMLCSAHRYASGNRKELSVVGDPERVFAGTLELAGFARHVGCAYDCDGSCLWKRALAMDASGSDNVRGKGR